MGLGTLGLILLSLFVMLWVTQHIFFMYVDDILLQEIMMTSFSRFYIFFL